MGVAPRIARQSELFRYHAGAGERKTVAFAFPPVRLQFALLAQKQTFSVFFVGAASDKVSEPTTSNYWSWLY